MIGLKKIGNKASTLLKIKKKFLVPEFYSLSVRDVKKILISNKITEKEIFMAYKGTSKERNLISDKIKKGIIKINLSFLKKLNKKIIIRSSAIGEDNDKYSYAGIYESIICQNEPKVAEKNILYLISKAYSERVFLYTKKIGRKNFPEFSLFIQNYVPSEFGGIAFTTTYQEGRKGMLLNIVKGSVDNAVKGNKISSVFIDQQSTINGKAHFISKELILKIVSELKGIEKIRGSPQDVEWCYHKNKIYILQTRNITKQIEQEIQIYDNSNIAESYSGIVLPLTCSFVKLIYSQVYKDVARTSNISIDKIKENEDLFNNLINFFYGRIYYNMFSWYSMLTLFPGYNRNKQNLDQMISIKSMAELDERYHRNVHLFDKIKYYSHISWRIIWFEKELQNFKKHVNSYLQDVKSKSLNDMSLSELWKQFEDYKKELLCRWSITVDNDFLAMSWFGIYKKYAKNLKLNDSEMIDNISSMHALISAEQVKGISNLAKQLQKDKGLMRLANEKKWEECYIKLMNNSRLAASVNEYLSLYGGRFANELKLESKDLDSDPTYLIKLLFVYKDWIENKNTKIHHTKSPIILKYLASITKHYLRHREELRLLRSQAFSFTRKLFIVIGKKLQNQGKIKSDEDIFYLELKEIESLIKNKNIDTKKLIDKRKREYSTYEDISLENILIVRNDELPQPISLKKTLKTDKFQGTGCSPGKISGKITIMTKFQIPDEPLEIVVVKHTDPGWTSLFGLCKGLIVENGGILSHAAIISRELNLPCIIGVKNVTNLLKNNQKISMNGSTGIIQIED